MRCAARFGGSGFFGEVRQNLVDDRGVVNAADNLYRTLAVGAGLDIDVNDTLQPLGPRHGGTGRDGGFRFRCLLSPATWRRDNLCAPVMVRGKDAVKTGEVDAGIWY